MLCESCSLDNLPGLFCSQCGGPLVSPPETCSSCGNMNVSGNYCNECGSPLSLHNCPSCGAKNQTDDFCTDCGDRVSGLEAPATVPQSVQKFTALSLPRWQDEVAYCTMCYEDTKSYAGPGLHVAECTACGAPARHIKF